MYIYQATLVEVTDGDSVQLLVDFGFRISQHQRMRLAGIDAPETRTAAGKAARAYLASIIPTGAFVIRTEKDRKEKFGRYLVHIVLPDGSTVNEAMVAAGHARPYDGGKRLPEVAP